MFKLAFLELFIKFFTVVFGGSTLAPFQLLHCFSILNNLFTDVDSTVTSRKTM